MVALSSITLRFLTSSEFPLHEGTIVILRNNAITLTVSELETSLEPEIF